jgi:hypothetical protein
MPSNLVEEQHIIADPIDRTPYDVEKPKFDTGGTKFEDKL